MFHLTFPGSELQERLESAAKWHDREQKRYEAKAKRRKARDDDEDDEVKTPLGTVKPDHEGAAKAHRGRARILREYAAHVVPSETYQITTEEASELELWTDLEEEP